jgi:hypothetical protein
MFAHLDWANWGRKFIAGAGGDPGRGPEEDTMNDLNAILLWCGDWDEGIGKGKRRRLYPSAEATVS